MGHLELVFLEFDGRAIAFELGWSSKGWYFSPKVGYDEEYSHLTPGQLLRLKLAERFFADHDQSAWDFLGPLVESTEKWTTASYPIERLVVSTGGVGGDAFMHAYRHWWPSLRRCAIVPAVVRPRNRQWRRRSRRYFVSLTAPTNSRPSVCQGSPPPFRPSRTL